MYYCPIMRNFYRLRAVLVEELGLPRQAIRPSMTFAELVPRAERPRVWRRFRQEEIKAPELAQSGVQACGCIVGTSLAVLFPLFLGWPDLVTALLWIPTGICIFWLLGKFAKELDPEFTLGDAALLMTSVKECRDAGYQFTSNEVFVKVRATVSDFLNVPRSQITRETRLTDFCD